MNRALLKAISILAIGEGILAVADPEKYRTFMRSLLRSITRDPGATRAVGSLHILFGLWYWALTRQVAQDTELIDARDVVGVH